MPCGLHNFTAASQTASSETVHFTLNSMSELTPTADERDGRTVFVAAPDGLHLHVREYGQAIVSPLAVVCLPGLARTTVDFAALAPALANAKAGWRVIAIDSRGRGQSEYDANPKHYNLAVELADVVALLSTFEIKQAVFIGSSRGGILTMLLAAAHPQMIAGAVLHDIGPVIEMEGVEPHQILCRKVAAAAESRGRRRGASQVVRGAVPEAHRCAVAQRGTTHVESGSWAAGADL
jgi:pimeloyl-ACP methyl ester carboxylesterase